MPFIANTDDQRKQMLDEIGLSMGDLFADIPPELMCGGLDLPEGMSELKVRDHMAALAEKNSTHLTSFLGGGFYDHFIPAAVPALIGRGEFYTAYTPYQPEISQGTSWKLSLSRRLCANCTRGVFRDGCRRSCRAHPGTSSSRSAPAGTCPSSFPPTRNGRVFTWRRRSRRRLPPRPPSAAFCESTSSASS